MKHFKVSVTFPELGLNFTVTAKASSAPVATSYALKRVFRSEDLKRKKYETFIVRVDKVTAEEPDAVDLAMLEGELAAEKKNEAALTGSTRNAWDSEYPFGNQPGSSTFERADSQHYRTNGGGYYRYGQVKRCGCSEPCPHRG
jgi:hypothetical protein